MVRCTMCDSLAEINYSIRGYGELEVCGIHYDVLLHSDKCKRNEYENKFREILMKLINSLNKHYIKIPLVQAPTRKFENNGRRWGLKTAITEIEKELEVLLK